MQEAPRPLGRIVVVDDEELIGELVVEASRLVGLECTVTHRVETFRDALAADVVGVLVDLLLPGTDGIEILRQLGAASFSAAVILVSGMDRSVLRAAAALAKSLGLRVAGQLEKPFRVESLIGMLNKIREATPSPPPKDRVTVTDADIHEALERQDFELAYQPQVDLRSGRPSGFEALVRMRHPEHGVVAPGAFLDALIKLGRIEELNSIIFPRALAEFGQLKYEHKLSLSLNILPESLTDLDLPDRLQTLAQNASVSPDSLVVEVTETGLVGELGASLDVLARLRIKGIGVSVDDYGTGYSSMAQLRTVPATELKIDRLFVKDLENDVSSRAMVSKTIQLGHEMQLSVVAEGNETSAQTNFLIRYGCDIGQGYYFSKPLRFDQVQLWIDEHPKLLQRSP